ncbi:Rz1-like lysis system protein LysC [Acinetobacter baumannii]|uniref:Rz1-like lysis system protein LysC n=1 Tax=Acinetobacter calcoaceticus/baumannii complex TaxID=909768 RepID=UPI003B986672
MKCKRSLSVLFISIAVLILTGCTRSTVLLKPNVPANLMQPCERFNKLEDGTGKVITPWIIDTLAKGNDCAAKVDAWIEIGKALR